MIKLSYNGPHLVLINDQTIERTAIMKTTKLENKLIEFYTHYEALTNLINFLANTLLSDDPDEIPRGEIDTMIETIAEKTQGKLTELKEIIDEFQENLCH